MSSLADTLAWLVDIESPTGFEAEISHAIAARLSPLPQVRVQDSLVVGEVTAGVVLLAGHLDTVPRQGQGPAHLADGRLHGLGASDMKAGLAVMIHLLEDLDAGSSVVAVFYAGEEGPLSGNQLDDVLDACPSLHGASASIVMEPTDRQIQAGCNGVVNARVVFEGVPAHSARPWLGTNAVTKAGPFLDRLHRRAPDLHVVSGLEFTEVVSVTRAQGGIASNVIPGHFELLVNYRFAPDRTPREAVDHLRKVCAECDGFEVVDLAPAARVEVDHPLFRRLAEVSSAPVAGKQGWTDVATLTAAGIPAVNFGPGDTRLAHKPDESVQLDDLDWAYRSLLSILR